MVVEEVILVSTTLITHGTCLSQLDDVCKTSPNTLDRGILNSSAVDVHTAKLGEIVRE